MNQFEKTFLLFCYERLVPSGSFGHRLEFFFHLYLYICLLECFQRQPWVRNPRNIITDPAWSSRTFRTNRYHCFLASRTPKLDQTIRSRSFIHRLCIPSPLKDVFHEHQLRLLSSEDLSLKYKYLKSEDLSSKFELNNGGRKDNEA